MEMLKGEYILRWPHFKYKDWKTAFDPEHPDSRRINVKITSWVGTSAGAKHIYVTVEEEENMYWCEEKNAWLMPFAHSDVTGYSFKGEVLTDKEALDFAKQCCKIILNSVGADFKNKKHYKISWNKSRIPKWAK